MSEQNRMNEKKLYELMGSIDPDIIAEANQPVPFRQKRGFKIALIAAVLAFCMLLTPVAGAFALVAFYQQSNPPSGGNADSSEQESPSYRPGGLISELLGNINWDALGDAIGSDGNVRWDAVFDALQGKDPTSSETIGVNDYVTEAVILDDGTVKITQFNHDSNTTVITVPETIAGHKVTAIGKGALAYGETITHVSLPDTVTLIESGAFSGCSGLLTVDMSDNVTEIGEKAFENCSSLTTIDLPATLQYLGDNVFANCTNLTKIRLPNGISRIPDYAFYGTAITEVTIPSSVKEIGAFAFARCAALSTVNLSSYDSILSSSVSNATSEPSLQVIGQSAFDGTAITNLTIPQSVTEMYDVDFQECFSLQSVIFMGDAPTVFRDATHSKNSPDYTVYYMLGSQGFSEPQWNGYSCELLAYKTDSYVMNYLGPFHYSDVSWLRAEVVSGENMPVPSDPVTVLDSWEKYSEYADALPATHYDSTYFDRYAILLIKVKHTSSETVLGLSGIAAMLYSMGGNIYFELNPIIHMGITANDVDSPDNSGAAADLQFTYVIAEVRRADIRTDKVNRVGEVVVYDKNSSQDYQYHRGLVDFLNKENAKDGK